MRRLLILVMILLGVGFGITSCSDDRATAGSGPSRSAGAATPSTVASRPASDTIGPNSSAGSKLAVIDGEAYLQSDVAVVRYERMLSDLAQDCGLADIRMADQVVATAQMFNDRGGTESTMSIMQALRSTLDGGGVELGVDCTELLAMLVAISD